MRGAEDRWWLIVVHQWIHQLYTANELSKQWSWRINTSDSNDLHVYSAHAEPMLSLNLEEMSCIKTADIQKIRSAPEPSKIVMVAATDVPPKIDGVIAGLCSCSVITGLKEKNKAANKKKMNLIRLRHIADSAVSCLRTLLPGNHQTFVPQRFQPWHQESGSHLPMLSQVRTPSKFPELKCLEVQH